MNMHLGMEFPKPQVAALLQNIKDHYDLVAPLGTGGFAKVFKGKNKKSGDDVAIKHIEIIE
jgi:serine/threonine protein kinase